MTFTLFHVCVRGPQTEAGTRSIVPRRRFCCSGDPVNLDAVKWKLPQTMWAGHRSSQGVRWRVACLAAQCSGLLNLQQTALRVRFGPIATWSGAAAPVCVHSKQNVSCPLSELSIPVPWGQLRGRVWGPDDGRPVLCLHGWSDNCGTFNTLIPLLPKGEPSWSHTVVINVHVRFHSIRSKLPLRGKDIQDILFLYFYTFRSISHFLKELHRYEGRDVKNWNRFMCFNYVLIQLYLLFLIPKKINRLTKDSLTITMVTLDCCLILSAI